jgi:hypothetical protein
MRRRFGPSVTMLEGRQLLSSASSHMPVGMLIESIARSSRHAISGTLSGVFLYTYIAPTANYPPSYQFELRALDGQLNKVQMGGQGGILINGQSVHANSVLLLGQFEHPPGSQYTFNSRLDRLVLTPVNAPFAPSPSAPDAFNLLVRVKSANGVFKHDVGQVLSMAMVLSNEGTEFTATVQTG